MILKFPKTLFFFTIILAIITLIILLFLVMNLFPRHREKQSPSPTPSPKQESSFSSPFPISKSSIQPITTSPKEDPTGKTIKNPSQKIEVTFSQTLTPSDVKVIASPPLPLKVQRGGTANSLIIFPDPPEFWKPDVLYTIKILDNKQRLITEYQIKVPLLKVPDILD